MKTYISILNIAMIALMCVMFISCESDLETLTKNIKTDPSIESAAIPTPVAWFRVFTENFDNNASFNRWEKTHRLDYNSSICMYDSAVPYISTFEGKTVLVLTATALANGTYRSGHVKSYFEFVPDVDEEYHIVSKIKLVAADYRYPIRLRSDNPNPDIPYNSPYIYRNFAETYGAWPAFWTVQETDWPTKGEIDIMEGFTFGQIGQERYASNLFYGTTVGQNLLGTNAERPYMVSAALGTGIYQEEGWHTYEAYWTNDNGVLSVRVKYDGLEHTTYTNSIDPDLELENFGPHNIILNLNVGHDPDENGNPVIFNNADIELFAKTMMLVDFVTVTKRNL